jgi:drug/metabolite transporter (DMT)-like permease
MASASWLVLALAAAMLWGLQYALYGQVSKVLSPAIIMATTVSSTLPVWLYLAWKRWGEEAHIVAQSHIWPLLAGIAVVGFLANLAIILSIQQRNATLAALVEMSYPLFTALFAYVLFKQVELGWQHAVGGALVAAGILLIGTAKAHG